MLAKRRSSATSLAQLYATAPRSVWHHLMRFLLHACAPVRRCRQSSVSTCISGWHSQQAAINDAGEACHTPQAPLCIVSGLSWVLAHAIRCRQQRYKSVLWLLRWHVLDKEMRTQRLLRFYERVHQVVAAHAFLAGIPKPIPWNPCRSKVPAVEVERYRVGFRSLGNLSKSTLVICVVAVGK
jgi:hypothetical protein